MFESILKSIGLIVVAIIGVYGIKLLKKRKERQNERRSLLVSFEQINNLNETISDMFFHTSADRFLLLIANINEGNNNWISAVYEQHKKVNHVSLSYGATNRYIKLNIDEEYKEIILEAKERGVKRLTTDSMNSSLLKNIYVYEKIKHSSIYYIFEYVEDGNDMILVCSIAKHQDEVFSLDDETYFKLVVDKITNNILVI